MMRLPSPRLTLLTLCASAACAAAPEPGAAPPPQTHIEPSPGADAKATQLGVGDAKAKGCFEVAQSVARPRSCGDECVARCRERDLEACFDIATALGAEPSRRECSAKIFDLACTADYPRACAALADVLIAEDSPAGAARADKLLEQACKGDVGAACTRRGKRMLALVESAGGSGDATPALAELSRGCDLGDAEGCYVAAMRYRSGMPYDYAAAARLLGKSCDLGLGEGCLEYGRGLIIGTAGFTYDPTTGAQVLDALCHSDAAAAGEACFVLGSSVANATPATAEALLQLGCDKGHMNACSEVANSHYNAGRFEEAIAVEDKLIGDDPDNWGHRWIRGLSRVHTAKYAEAAEDLALVCPERPDIPHCELLLYISREKSGSDGKAGLLAAWARIDQTAWPAPVFKHYLGKLGAAQLIKAAQNPMDQVEREQQCEAYFYIGEGLLLRGRKQDAAAMFQKSVDTQVSYYIEYSGSKAELARLTP